MATILILPMVPNIWQEKPDPQDVTKKIMVEIHQDQLTQWLADNGIELETGLYQISNDGCYECDANGSPKRDTDKKTIMKPSTLGEVDPASLTQKQKDELEARGVTVKHAKKPWQPAKTGFAAVAELEEFIKKNNLLVDALELERIKGICAQTEISKGIIPPQQIEHEIEAYFQTDDFVKHCPVEFKIHPGAGIAQKELDAIFAKKSCDFGNNKSLNQPWKEGFKLSFMILKHGTTITDKKFNDLAKEMQRTE